MNVKINVHAKNVNFEIDSNPKLNTAKIVHVIGLIFKKKPILEKMRNGGSARFPSFEYGNNHNGPSRMSGKKTLAAEYGFITVQIMGQRTSSYIQLHSINAKHTLQQAYTYFQFQSGHDNTLTPTFRRTTKLKRDWSFGGRLSFNAFTLQKGKIYLTTFKSYAS